MPLRARSNELNKTTAYLSFLLIANSTRKISCQKQNNKSLVILVILGRWEREQVVFLPFCFPKYYYYSSILRRKK